METFEPKTGCKKCGNLSLKSWPELDRDEKIVAERLPATTGFSEKELRKLRFCTRCWNIRMPDEHVVG